MQVLHAEFGLRQKTKHNKLKTTNIERGDALAEQKRDITHNEMPWGGLQSLTEQRGESRAHTPGSNNREIDKRGMQRTSRSACDRSPCSVAAFIPAAEMVVCRKRTVLIRLANTRMRGGLRMPLLASCSKRIPCNYYQAALTLHWRSQKTASSFLEPG